MNSTLAQRAQLLAHELLLASYEPAPDVPVPGSSAWQLTVEKVTKHFLHLFGQNKHLLLRSGPPPAMPALGPGAAAATRARLLSAKGDA